LELERWWPRPSLGQSHLQLRGAVLRYTGLRVPLQRVLLLRPLLQTLLVLLLRRRRLLLRLLSLLLPSLQLRHPWV
jgi:hypothetical protein